MNPTLSPKTYSVNTQQRPLSCFGRETQIKTLKLDNNCHQAPLHCGAPQAQFVILKDVSVDSKSICGYTVLGVQPSLAQTGASGFDPCGAKEADVVESIVRCAQRFDLAYAGGCCGTTPALVDALSKALSA